jgi:hypothetical protein
MCLNVDAALLKNYFINNLKSKIGIFHKVGKVVDRLKLKYQRLFSQMKDAILFVIF